MKRSLFCIVLAVAVLLGGCSLTGASYYSVTPHHEQLSGVQSDNLHAANYAQLREILCELVETGAENAVIYVPEYDQSQLERGMDNAVRYIREVLPLGAYAIDKVVYEMGTSAGQPAISVDIVYLHGRAELRRIKQASNMEAVKIIINKALADCDDSLVVYVDKYADVDLVQLVEDYAMENPDVIMEIPQVAVGLYPEQGSKRVLELKFTYQTSRDTLRSMQTQVKRVFASAALLIDQNIGDEEKYTQLYTFLTFLAERSDYKVETSITPSYSLLCHGVGDAKTYAMVYTEMCRSAGLDCKMVSGTRSSEAWYWNLICVDDVYYHVDLLAGSAAGQFIKLSDAEMAGYVWDYSAYPAAGMPEETVAATE